MHQAPEHGNRIGCVRSALRRNLCHTAFQQPSGLTGAVVAVITSSGPKSHAIFDFYRLHQVSKELAVVRVLDLAGHVIGDAGLSGIAFGIAFIIQPRDRCAQHRGVIGQLLQESDLTAGRDNRDLVARIHAAIDKLPQGLARAHQTLAAQMHVVHKEKDQTARGRANSRRSVRGRQIRRTFANG